MDEKEYREIEERVVGGLALIVGHVELLASNEYYDRFGSVTAIRRAAKDVELYVRGLSRTFDETQRSDGLGEYSVRGGEAYRPVEDRKVQY